MTLSKGSLASSTKKRPESATAATKGTIERGSGWGGFRGLGSRRISGEYWATWLLGSSSGLFAEVGFA